jgi:hypothetical protein
MTVLRIEHPVPDFDGWKRAFDSDPAGRKAGGVRSYRVLRPVDDRNYAIVDLEFEDLQSAHAFLEVLKKIWRNAEGKVMTAPQARIFEIVEQAGD